MPSVILAEEAGNITAAGNAALKRIGSNNNNISNISSICWHSKLEGNKRQVLVDWIQWKINKTVKSGIPGDGVEKQSSRSGKGLNKKKTFGRACNHRLPKLASIELTWESKYVCTPLPLVVTTQFEPHLWELRNASRARVPIERLIVAYSRPPNLKNLLFPRHVESKCPTARPVSSIQTEILDPSSNTESN